MYSSIISIFSVPQSLKLVMLQPWILEWNQTYPLPKWGKRNLAFKAKNKNLARYLLPNWIQPLLIENLLCARPPTLPNPQQQEDPLWAIGVVYSSRQWEDMVWGMSNLLCERGDGVVATISTAPWNSACFSAMLCLYTWLPGRPEEKSR